MINIKKKILTFSFLTILTRLSGFITFPIFYRLLSEQEIYYLEFYYVLYFLFNVIFSMQLNTGYTRDYFNITNKNTLKETNYTIILFFLFILFIFYILFFFFQKFKFF